jgi:transcriptional regulator with XRE-family HTH domain
MAVTRMIPKEVDYAKIGQRIRSLRQSKNMTQAELSALVDCSNNYLSHIETAQCKVSLSMLLKLSYALEESIEYFLLDTPYACAETIINREISKKLAKCSPSTLNVASKMIDILLEQQDSLSAE